MKFTKVIVAKYYPDDGCWVEDGAILTVLPKKLPEKVKEGVSHYFVDSLDRKTKSRYGWVKSIDPFSLEEFVEKYCKGTSNELELDHIKKLLEGASLSRF